MQDTFTTLAHWQLSHTAFCYCCCWFIAKESRRLYYKKTMLQKRQTRNDDIMSRPVSPMIPDSFALLEPVKQTKRTYCLLNGCCNSRANDWILLHISLGENINGKKGMKAYGLNEQTIWTETKQIETRMIYMIVTQYCIDVKEFLSNRFLTSENMFVHTYHHKLINES